MARQDTFIPELWAAALERGLEKETIWGGLTRDVSAELPMGNKLHINEITTAITLQDYAVGTALPDPQVPVTADTELELNKQKAFNIMVHDLDRIQSRGDTLTEFTRLAAVKLSGTFDADLYGAFNSGWDDSGADQNRFTHTKTVTSSDHRKAFVAALRDLQRRANIANWPAEGRWMVMSSNAFDYVMAYLTEDNTDFGAGGFVDAAFSEGTRPRLFGFSVYVDNQIPVATAANNPYVLCGTNRWGVFARQVNAVESYRPESHFSDAVKGLLVYGVKEIHKESKLALVQAA